MLSEKQKEIIVNRVNRDHDFPFISEGTEKALLTKMADKINPAVEDALRVLMPLDYVAVIKLALMENLSKEERCRQVSEILVRRLAEPLTDAVNERVDLKLLPESVEQKVLQRLIIRGIEGVVELTLGEVDEALEAMLTESRGV
eukprot:Plantae.Rhodophyta-Rhodochaete_pulchella.ctg7709.p1 GENE.Plantae.Rhodophyta-Rhodochaete_pulchella.ctg7709~~Plantae.Rhodophyta-Rhodochaete_pulchella.ctg7709.p1  ORF type:complete len:144 (+),score=36.24 Plantae.Rhodophyta-Rhodochaete_pulchella.ctg7709:270-701(+)